MNAKHRGPLGWIARRFADGCFALHRDQRGAISIPSVFALMLLVMLLGMVMNSGQQADQKLKMQNAADAATYSGGVVLTRSMNTLAFTNHLLSDVFALTAFLRESRDRFSESLTPEILDRWAEIGPIMASSEFPKFAALGQAIIEKTPREREMIAAYSEWGAAASELMLPVMEDILAERRIPEFQRAIVAHTPRLAQYAADTVAERHGQAWPRSTELRAVLWRTIGDPVGGPSEEMYGTVPAIDPVMGALDDPQAARREAKAQRDMLARYYLAEWNQESMFPFDVLGKFSQFSSMWRIFTCGQLEKLLDKEYANTNLPHLIRTPVDQIENRNQHLEQEFMFVGVVYREPAQDYIPGIFKNPMPAAAQAYSQVMIYVPRRRLVKVYPDTNPLDAESPEIDFGGVPGERVSLPGPAGNGPPADDEEEDDEVKWFVARQTGAVWPEQHDLLCQNWSMQLTPATARNLATILSTPPTINGLDGIEPADVRVLSAEDMQWLSHH